MSEYCTTQLEQTALKAELAAACDILCRAGITEVTVSFGWDCNLAIQDMWKDKSILVKDLCSYIELSERSNLVVIGQGDIFINAADFCFTLCHESDVHVQGESPVVREIVNRWETLGYEPHAVQPRA